MVEEDNTNAFTDLVTHVSPPDFADINFRSGYWGEFARITNISRNHVTSITHQLDGRNGVDFAVTETASELAVEVYTTERLK